MKALLSRGVPPRAVLPVLALALIASVVIGREKPAEMVAAVDVQPERSERAANVARQELAIDLDRLQQREMQNMKTDPFAPLPVEQAAAVTSQPAPAPQAPALPFVYVGKMVDGEKTAVFVSKGDENYSLTPGQTIAGDYRVEKITDASVTFTYLPMKKRQTLNFTAQH
jgi:type IV pilus biogenesis protein PilP